MRVRVRVRVRVHVRVRARVRMRVRVQVCVRVRVRVRVRVHVRVCMCVRTPIFIDHLFCHMFSLCLFLALSPFGDSVIFVFETQFFPVFL